MRGKIALSLSMTLLMLLGIFAGVGHADIITTTLSVEPSYVTGDPGDVFDIDITVTDVVDLYTFAFELHFAPFGDVLTVLGVSIDSPFLGTTIIKKLDVLSGNLMVGSTKTGPVPGETGSGVLCTVTFQVVEAGESGLNLAETELHDSSPESLIPHNVVNGYYQGPVAEMTEPAMLTGVRGDSAVAKVGDTITLASSVTSTFGSLPLDVQVRYDLMRRDGKVLTLWSPQPRIIELYVDGYDGSWDLGWSHFGSSPYLDAVGDGNMIEGYDYCAIDGMYSLEDFALLPGEVIQDVKVEAWSKAESGEIDGDIYFFTDETSWYWAGSIEAGSDWGWYFTDAGAAGALDDETSINAAEILLHYWTPDGSSGPSQTIDAIRVVVTTAITVTVDPGETVDMPLVTYTLTSEDKGVYRSLTAKCYYTYMGKYIGYLSPEQPIIVVGGDGTPRDFLIVSGKP